ncbi:MAG: DUF2846 domain-containing protein [Aeromonadales bacterium]|nr:DUF2846 domain-containing protein [Aeromonadales bacterium]
MYRDGSIAGSALKKSLYVDSNFIGESVRSVYFLVNVQPGVHKISTESEFSPNHLTLTAEPNTNTFVQNASKFGVFVGGAKVNVVDGENCRKAVLECNKAKLRYGEQPDLTEE